jgi:hypothetical protein
MVVGVLMYFSIFIGLLAAVAWIFLCVSDNPPEGLFRVAVGLLVIFVLLGLVFPSAP